MPAVVSTNGMSGTHGKSHAPKTDARAGVVPGRPTHGESSAPVHVVVWVDPQCPHCARADAALQKALNAHESAMFVEWRFNPLAGHPEARTASEYALGVYALSGAAVFERYLTQELGHMHALDESRLLALALDAGLENDKVVVLREGVHAHRWEATLTADMREFTERKYMYLPLVLVNDQLIDDVLTLPERVTQELQTQTKKDATP